MFDNLTTSQGEPILYTAAIVVFILALFEAIMKAIAMWKAARNNHLAWFVCITVFNTVGILPIIYIILDKKGKFAPIEEDVD